MKRSMLLSSLVAAGTLAFTALPVGAVELGEKFELQLSGQARNDPDFDVGEVIVNGSLGYFVQENIQVGVRQTIGYADFGDSTWSAGTRVFGQYHFNADPDQRLVPYLGAFFGYVYGENTTDSFTAGPEVGVKYYLTDNAFIFGSVLYEFFFNEGDDASDSISDGQFLYQIGIGLNF